MAFVEWPPRTADGAKEFAVSRRAQGSQSAADRPDRGRRPGRRHGSRCSASTPGPPCTAVADPLPDRREEVMRARWPG